MSLITIVILIIAVIICIAKGSMRPTPLSRYRYCISIISAAVIPVAGANIFAMANEIKDQIQIAAPDSTGLGTILNLFTLMGTPAIILYTSIIIILAYLGFILVLWLIYAIWYAVDKHKEKKK